MLSPTQSEPALSLRNLAINRGLRIGTATPTWMLQFDHDNGAYRDFVLSNFTVVEPENDGKPPFIWKSENEYNLERADWLFGAPGKIGWAQRNGLAARGHVLVYAKDEGYTLPQWIRDTEDQITPEKARELLRDYIFTVAGRYKGRIVAWDVVNEAIDDEANDRPFQLRDSFWFRKLGRDFLKLAFQFAHEADPHAELYYNDFDAEGINPKSDAIFEMVQWLRSEGVFITGVGMQWHINVQTKVEPGDGFYRNAERLQKAGFDFEITELDVAVPVVPYDSKDPRYGQEPQGAAALAEQAEVYRSVLRYALHFPNCRGFQVWGACDKLSWIPEFSQGVNGAPLLADAAYQPKPAHAALVEELSGVSVGAS